MTLPACFDKLGGVYRGKRVGSFENGVRGMAIGASGYLFRITETVVFAMITFHVGFSGHIEDIIAFHHGFVAVALQADPGVKYPVLVGCPFAQGFYVVKIVAIVAGGGILIACRHGGAVD